MITVQSVYRTMRHVVQYGWPNYHWSSTLNRIWNILDYLYRSNRYLLTQAIIVWSPAANTIKLISTLMTCTDRTTSLSCRQHYFCNELPSNIRVNNNRYIDILIDLIYIINDTIIIYSQKGYLFLKKCPLKIVYFYYSLL